MTPEELRKSVLVQVRTDGEGLADKLAVSLQNAYGRLASLQNQIASGATTVQESSKDYRALTAEISFIEKQLRTVNAEIRSSDAEWKRLQETLGAMNARVKSDAAEAISLTKQITQESLSSYHRREEESRLMQQLTEEEAQAERDLAAVRTHLAGMESRDAERKAAEFAAEAAREQIALQQSLAAMEKRSSEERVAAESRSTEARREGIKAIQDHVQAVSREVQAERDSARAAQERISTFNQLIGLQQISTTDVQRDTAAIEANVQVKVRAGREQQQLNAFLEIAAAHETTAYRARGVLTEVTGRAATAMGRLSAGLDQGTSKSERASYALLNVAHAAQDLQYGLGAVLNNIPLVTSSLATAAGVSATTAAAWAGGLMIVAVAANSLYNNWDKLKDSVGVGIPTPVLDSTDALGRRLETASKEFETLAGKARLTFPELQRYKELNQEILSVEKEIATQREDERLRKLKSEQQQKVGSGFEKAVAESGGLDYVASQLRQALENVATQTGQAYTLEGIAKQADQMIRDAAGGDKDVRNDVRRAVTKFLPEGADGRFAKNIWKFSPEGEQSDRDRKEIQDEAEKAIKEDRKSAAREAKKEADDERDRVRADRQKKDQEFSQGVTEASSAQYGEMDKRMLRKSLEMKSGGATDDKVREALSKLGRPVLDAAGVGHQFGDDMERGNFQDAVLAKVVQKAMTAAQAKIGGNLAGMALGGNKIKPGDEKVAADIGVKEFEDKDDNAAERNRNKENTRQTRQQKAKEAARRRRIASGMQQAYGLSDDQAVGIAPHVDALMRKGMSPAAAGQAAMAKLTEFLSRQDNVIQGVQANQEMMMGFFGPAFQAMAAQKARNGQIQANLNRAAGGMRMGLLPVFPGF